MLVADKNFSLFVFGASGALARYKIFPALYELALEGRMPDEYNVFGYARSELSNEDLRQIFRESVAQKYKDFDAKIVDAVADKLFYFKGEYDSDEAYADFLQFVEGVEGTSNERVRLAYFSVPPVVFEPIVEGLGKVFKKSFVPIRLILEKPFGDDYGSSKELKRVLTKYFNQDEIYLLDHYLGKEGVFNLLALRYANPIFSYLLQGENIANIQVSALEEVGLEGRAGYFDEVGTLKDMVQSHLFQILAFLTMAIPRQFTTELVHKAKTQNLSSLYFDNGNGDFCRGQYEGYLNEADISKNSETETFVALKVGLDNAEWGGVPIFLRTGKKLAKKWTGVVIEFKPHKNQEKFGVENINRLVIQIQPQEKVEFYMYTKRGGEEMEFVPLTTGKPIYCTGDCMSEHGRLLLDVIKGNRLLFLDFPEIYEAWRVVDSVKNCFKNSGSALEVYKQNSFGPVESDKLIEKYGFKWFNQF
jgi:glucose-6-phosphate 1-dehydrogenase